MDGEKPSPLGIDFRAYLLELLTAVASIFLALFLLGLGSLGRSVSSSRQIGLTAAASGLMESALSGWFALALVACFSWLYAARCAGRKSVRAVLFWVPALAALVVGIGSWLGLLLLLRHVPAN
jgi:hypothetical protein